MRQRSRPTLTVLLAALAAAGWLVVVSTVPARADADFAGLMSTAEAYAAAVNASNGPAVQGLVTPELWARIAPTFASNPPPGSLCALTVGQAAPLGAANYGAVYMVCRHPDGVEDIVLLTFKQVNGGWKACGGPTGATRGNPLQ